MPASANEPRGFQLMLGLGGFVYLIWWFAVEALLPGSFNPLPGRLAVVAFFFAAFALSFVSKAIKQRAETLYYVGAHLLLGHYFYLLHNNASDSNWAVGAYVVVFALCVGVESRVWLFLCAGFSLGCGFAIWRLHPALQHTIFLQGLCTIMALCLTTQLSRIRLLERVSESAGRFQNLFDATIEGVAVHDAGKIIDVNAAFEAMFGYTREELIGRSVADLTAPEWRERVVTSADAPASRYESSGLRQDGTQFAVEISSKPHTYQGRALRLAAIHDITARQRAEQERLTLFREQAARASAQEAIRLRDEFISIASHELRTPITSLLLQLDVFVRQHAHGPASAEVDSYAVRVRRQLRRMERLVEELLDVSRLGEGRLTLTKGQVDFELIVRDVIDSLSEDLRRAACRAEIHSSGPIVGMWDRLRLEQVVENLVRNALIYGAGKPIELVLRELPGCAVLEVRDHGMGIDTAMQERVFLRFERGVSAQHYGGLGLGLYIARQIVEAHEGVVRVESKLGEGSTFSVQLPMGSVVSKKVATSQLPTPSPGSTLH